MRVPNTDQSADEDGYAVEDWIYFTQKWNRISLKIPPPPKKNSFFSEKLVVFKSIAEENKPLIFFNRKALKGEAKQIFVMTQWKTFLLFYLGCI